MSLRKPECVSARDSERQYTRERDRNLRPERTTKKKTRKTNRHGARRAGTRFGVFELVRVKV